MNYNVLNYNININKQKEDPANKCQHSVFCSETVYQTFNKRVCLNITIELFFLLLASN